VNPVRHAVANILQVADVGDVVFMSLDDPPYGEEELATISKAYPHLSIIYDYAEVVNNLFGRYSISNGVVSKASPAEMEGIKNTSLFRKIVRGPPKHEPKIHRYLFQRTQRRTPHLQRRRRVHQ